MSNNTKALKRALISSALSLFLCMAMLVGTTFAWFTDTVTSKNNEIVSGNLDVEMEYLDAFGAWQTLGKDTNVFMENTYWEPGHTEVVYLKIKNAGSLAFDYKLGVNIVEEVKSINVNDEELKLSDYIMMGAIKGVDTAYTDRDTARGALNLSEVKAIANGYAQDGTLYPANNIPTDIVGASDVDYVALVVYMPELIGNEANHKKGADIPKITLGINLLATQETYEKDSFDDQYDAGANVSVPPVPVAPETLTVDVYDVLSTGNPPTTLDDITMNIYQFIANDYQDVYPVDEYKDWTCDFFVSTAAPVDDGAILVGNYGTFGWLGFWVPENDQPYEPVGLLGYVTSGGESNWTYEDICNGVQIFRCGIVDYKGQNSGVEVTVDLRMKNPQTGESITVTSITVTLGQ